MERPLKTEIHAHSKEDPQDNVKYSAVELIDFMAEEGYEVLSITNHDTVTYSEELREYALSKGITLIPGVEATIENRHVLILNIAEYKKGDIKNFQELRRYKREDILIIAPHPYFHDFCCLGKKLDKNPDIFDAIEYSHFYIKGINPNKRAERFARANNIPLIGTSDIHFRYQEGRTYSIVNAKKDIPSILKAIREDKIRVMTTPLRYHEFIVIFFLQLLNLFNILFTIKKKRVKRPLQEKAEKCLVSQKD